MEQALTQLDVKILFGDLTYHANICNALRSLNLVTNSRSISLYHTSQLKILKQCKISAAASFFTILAQTFKLHFLYLI